MTTTPSVLVLLSQHRHIRPPNPNHPTFRPFAPVHLRSYCSETRTALPSIRTIEEGIRIIEEILSNNVLCRHDVEDINQTYREIDLLERRIDHIVEHTSQHALQKIIDRAKKIAQDKKITPADLISLYHLRNFSDKDLPITDYFKGLLSRFDKIPKYAKNSPLISLVVPQKFFLMKMCGI